MPRTTHVFSRPGWVVDHQSIDLNTGRQIDWAAVPEAYRNPDGDKEIRDGTVMTILNNGKMVPRALGLAGGGAAPATGETAAGARGIIIGTAVQGHPAMNRDMHGMVIGGVIFGNLLPESAAAGFAGWIGEVNGSGTGLVVETYQDNRIA